jgi:uncharacterized protein YecT (DUF1311 family)
MGRVILVIAMALAAFIATPPAHAQTRDASLDGCVAAAGRSRVALEACKGAMTEACLESEGGETTAGAVMCFDAETRRWTAQLDAALGRAGADDTRAAFLAQSQQAWTAWRQAECRYQASLYEGGSLARVLSASCFADLTADRAIAFIYAERNREE